MKILLTGANGRLGQELQNQDKSLFILVDHCDFDITDPFACQYFFKHNYENFDSVLHLAAYTNVAKAEQEKNKCFHINVMGTNHLLLQSIWHNKKFIYMSTDYVFDGKKGMYEEDYPKNPINYYSQTKSIGEDSIIKVCDNYLILRTSFKSTKFPHPYACNDIYTSADYIDVIAGLLLKAIKMDLNGIYHIGTERKTVHDLIKQRNPNIQPISRNDIKSVKLPYDVSLNCDKFNRSLK